MLSVLTVKHFCEGHYECALGGTLAEKQKTSKNSSMNSLRF